MTSDDKPIVRREPSHTFIFMGARISQDEFLTLLDLARNGIGELVTMQKDAIA